MLLPFLASWVCLGLPTLEVKASASTDIALLTKEIQGVKAELEAVRKNCSDIPVGGYIQEDGYILLIKIVAGIGESSGWVFYNSRRNDDDSVSRSLTPCTCLTNKGPCNRHYRSSVYNLWSRLDILAVKLAVYKDGEEKQYVVFNETTPYYWQFMDADKIADSSWTDLQTETKADCSFTGDYLNSRNLFISHTNGDCATDAGWLVVKDTPEECSWGNPEGARYPLILYSPQSTMVQWSDAEQADALGLWIKVKNVENLNGPCIQ